MCTFLFQQTWFNSYQSLFTSPCKKCGHHLHNLLPPTWRDLRNLDPYHEDCKPWSIEYKQHRKYIKITQLTVGCATISASASDSIGLRIVMLFPVSPLWGFLGFLGRRWSCHCSGTRTGRSFRFSGILFVWFWFAIEFLYSCHDGRALSLLYCFFTIEEEFV